MSSQSTSAQAIVAPQSLDILTKESEKRSRDLEKIFVQSFKHQKQVFGINRATRYVEKKLDYIADDETHIHAPGTFDMIRAICGAALKTDIPVGPVPLWRLQHNAEECGAMDLAKYVEVQSKNFKKQQTSFNSFMWRELRRLFVPVRE